LDGEARLWLERGGELWLEISWTGKVRRRKIWNGEGEAQVGPRRKEPTSDTIVRLSVSASASVANKEL
jgi:hypothetical protein